MKNKDADAAVPAPETAAQVAEMKTPEEWCELEGHLDVVKRGNVVVSRSPDWQHKAAAQCHGWGAAHAAHTSEPLLITRDAYVAAIAAILGPPYAPVKAACSPFRK